MSEIDRLAKLLAKNLRTNENVTIQGDEISFDGERLEKSGRSTRERVHRKERRYKDKKKVENPVFATIVLLVTVEREEEYELYILSENYSALKEGQRWWDISYAKSLPKYFTGAPWYAWGFPGFISEGVFSGAEYGFIDSIPSKEQFGFPSLLETRTLDVNQQLGISSPLFWDEDNPAPVTKVKASFKVTDAWFSGLLRDNYVEITHVYEDRYGGLSLKWKMPPGAVFPDDWWIYPYFGHDVDVEHLPSKVSIDTYRYAYSPDGSAIDFDTLSPSQYTTVIVKLWEDDQERPGLPIMQDDELAINGSSWANVFNNEELDPEWKRLDPDNLPPGLSVCSELTENDIPCLHEQRLTRSDVIFGSATDFGVATSWNVSCFLEGNLLLEKEENGETIVVDTIAVSRMPVRIEWAEVPAVVVITGIPDTYKPSASSVESGNPTTIEIELDDPPPSPVFTTETLNEYRFRWWSQTSFKEINATSYNLSYYTTRTLWRLRGSMYSNPGCYTGEFDQTLSFDPASWSQSGGFWANNCGIGALYHFEIVPGYSSSDYDPHTGLPSWPPPGWVSLANGWSLTEIPPTTTPYINFYDDSGFLERHTGTADDYLNGFYRITINSGSDTIVRVDGQEYYYANSPTVVVRGKYRLRVFENEVQSDERFFEQQYPVRLKAIQNITEYRTVYRHATISFEREFYGEKTVVSWVKDGATITADRVVKDCADIAGTFVYDKSSKDGYLGTTKITEQNSDRETEYLYKFMPPPRENGDEILAEEVEPELSITYVFAGGKIFSGVHNKGALDTYTKEIADPSPNHQADHIRDPEAEKIKLKDSLIPRTIVAPKEDMQSPDWYLPDLPDSMDDQENLIASVPSEIVSIGNTLAFIGTFDSEPEYIDGSTWKAEFVGLPIEYEYENEGTIPEYTGIQWSNHHEYYAPRKRDYKLKDISGREDRGEWLNGWEPMNTLGLTGYLPSGIFRSLSLRHETTEAKLKYGIKGAIETVQGVNKEPLHFVFAYGGIYAAFGKVNNGLDDDEKIMALKSPAGDDLTQLLLNKELQTQNSPPYPAEHELNLLMKSEGYTWGGFKNYICPYTPGLVAEVHSINAQLPFLMYPAFSSWISTSGIESTFEITLPFVDPEKTYSIAINGTSSTQTGISTVSALRSALLADFTGINGATVTSTSATITVRGKGLSVSTSGLDLTIDADDEPTPNITATIYLPGLNAPYALEIDGTPVSLSLSNGMTQEAALTSLLNSLSSYDAERVDDRIRIRGVYEVKQTIEKTHNDLTIVQTVEATESTDRPWRETEIKWDYTPEVGLQTSTNLELLSTANVSKYLKYDVFDYSVYPYAKIEDTRIFSVHDGEMLEEPQPNKLLDQDFLDNVEGEDTGDAIVVKYAKTADTIDWKETTVQVKKIQPSWFGAERDKVNIIAIAPSIISMPGASALVEIPIGIKEDYEEP
jgi:hypothetical protein